jgi:hypothetical protein
MGPVSRVTFIYTVHVGHSTVVDHGWRSDPPRGTGGQPSMFLSVDGGPSLMYNSDTSQGPRRRCFLALMVGAPGSSSAPPRGLAVDVCCVDGGHSWISSSNTSQGGPPSMFLSVDGGRSRFYSFGTSQRVRRRCFLALMVDALGSIAPAPPRGSAVDIS